MRVVFLPVGFVQGRRTAPEVTKSGTDPDHHVCRDECRLRCRTRAPGGIPGKDVGERPARP